MYPFKLLTATLIAVRAFEINVEADLANKIVKLLSSIRKIANEWIRKIETAIRDMANPDENTERNLRLKLIYVSIIGGLTFFIHPTNEWYDNIFSGDLESKEAVRSWLLFIISLTNNIRMYTNNEDQLPSNLYMLIRLIESIGVSLEDKVTEVIERDAEFIFALIKRQWPRAEFAIFRLEKKNQSQFRFIFIFFFFFTISVILVSIMSFHKFWTWWQPLMELNRL